MESLPGYVSIVFILATFTAIGFLLQASKFVGLQTTGSKTLLFLLPLWILFQAVLAIGGFYQNTDAILPRLFVFGLLPALTLVAVSFIFFRAGFIERLPLKLLTLVHIVRVPIELVLYWLFLGGQIPQEMTFEGWNFDIASGIFAPVIYLIAFRGSSINRFVLTVYNVFGLALLVNIVSIAALSITSPNQMIAFGQPNRAVLFFPYVWLPTIVVPIVLFSHLASLGKLYAGKTI